MPTFRESGFLSEEMPSWVKRNKEENKEWFALHERINRAAHKLVFEMIDRLKTKKELILAALYIRMLSISQAVIVLAEKGMVTESRILIRAIFEGAFVKGHEVLRS